MTMTRVVVSRANPSSYGPRSTGTPNFSDGPPSFSEEVFRRDGNQTIKISWLTARQLLVECEGMPMGEQNSRERQWEEVKISLKCPG